MGEQRTSIVFVCQGGELEVKSMLLAASLREYGQYEQELVAAIPGPASAWKAPCDATLRLLARLDVRSVPIVNPIGTEYPIGNKLACLGIATSADRRLFLDSDMVALARFDPASVSQSPFAARLAAETPFENPIEQLRLAFAAAGCDLPAERFQSMAGMPIPPYFNAGFIQVDASIPFGEVWLDCCRQIEAEPAVTCKRPFLDQLGLAAAVCRLGLEYDLLDARFNWPRRKTLVGQSLPLFLHYRKPDIFTQDFRVRDAVVHLAERHRELQEVAATYPAWRLLANEKTPAID